MKKAKNILFIVADDLNSWIEPLGRHPDVRTPNIASLAKSSAVFTRAYCSAPYCNASRMSVFTGCLPGKTGIYQNEKFWEGPLRRKTFLESLRENWFHCFGAGKVFHGSYDFVLSAKKKTDAPFVEQQNRSFLWDQFHSSPFEPMPAGRPLNGMFNFDSKDSVPSFNFLFDWGELPPEREADMSDAKTVQRVSDFLAAPPIDRFICAAGLYKPHLPWYLPKRFLDMYPLESVTLPVVKNDDLDDVPDIPREWVAKRPDHQNVVKHDQWRNAVQGYLAAISYCDMQIGRILTALDLSPARDDTVVVLWGDNGFHLGEKLHWRKFVLWEEATRVPLIIRPPGGLPAERRINEPVSLVDLWPTLAEICDFPAIPDIDGTSLVDLVEGRVALRKTPVTTTWLRGNHSIRVGQWRYTRYSNGGEELYDQMNDPYEWTNLSDNPSFWQKRNELRGLLGNE